MTHPNFEPSGEREVATPEQVQELLDEISDITLQGDKHTARSRVKVEEMPSEIAAHLSQPDVSIRYADSVSVTQELDRHTSQLLQQEVAGRVIFTRKERIGPLVYATHVNYSVVTDSEGELALERHMTSSEDDMHAQEARRRRMARILWGSYVFALERLNDMQAMQTGVESTHPAEPTRGVFAVTKLEAQQVLEHVRGLRR